MNRDEISLLCHRFANWYFGYKTTIPNVTIDNMKYYDYETWEALKPGFKARLFKFTTQSAKMHLDDSEVRAIFAVVDTDGDGYIDEPRFISEEDGTFYPMTDIDGDGKIGNTSLKYADYIDTPNYKRGITHPTCTANLNKVRPPKYFKVINNKYENGDVVCNYIVKDTSGENISDGGWYRDASEPDTMGGFFGGTKFIFGEGCGDYVVGTSDKESSGGTFEFTEEYYVQ